MVDPSLLLTSVSTSVEMLKGLLKVKEIANSAEAKMAIADLTVKLAESQTQIAAFKMEQLAKDDTIRDLERKLALKSQLVRQNELYFDTDDKGEPTGDPYCPNCFEVTNLGVHLVSRRPGFYEPGPFTCPNCNGDFSRTPNA